MGRLPPSSLASLQLWARGTTPFVTTRLKCAFCCLGAVAARLLCLVGPVVCLVPYVVSGDKISAVTQISEVAVMGIYLYLGIINYFSHQQFF